MEDLPEIELSSIDCTTCCYRKNKVGVIGPTLDKYLFEDVFK